MAGQQNLRTLSQNSYSNEFLKRLLEDADKYYLQTKFAVETNYSRHKRRHSQLYYNVLSGNSCELVNWIKNKIAGKLGDENIEIVDLQSLQTNYTNNIINNYYINNNHWIEEVEW